MKHNSEIFARNLNLQPPDAALFINGLYFDAESLDVETLLDTIKTESRILDGLNSIGLKGSASGPLLAVDFASQAKEFAIDIRDSSVIWMNDLETDKEYKRWGGSVMDMLRPTFPGMMRSVRKNFFNLILIFDPIKPDGRDLVKISEGFVNNQAPLRLGVVFDTHLGVGELENVYRTINCAFNYYHQKKGSREAFSFLTDVFASVDSDKDITLEAVQKIFKQSNHNLIAAEIEDILGEDSDYDYGRQLSEEFVERLGVKKVPQGLLNGVLLSEKQLNKDEFEELILTEIMQQTPNLQKAIYRGDLSDGENVIDYLMQQPHVMLRLNQRILSNENSQHLDLHSGRPATDIEDVKLLATLSNEDLTATLIKHVRYFEPKNSQEKFMKNKLHFVSMWVATDLNTQRGRELLRNGLEYLKGSSGVRLTFLPNADKISSNNQKDLNAVVWSILYTLDSGKEAIDTAIKILDGKGEIPSNVKGFLKASELHLKMLRVYCQRVLKLKSSQTAVIANGRIFGPFEEEENFTVDDFNLLEKINQQQYISKVKAALKSLSEDDFDLELRSDLMLRLLSILMPPRQSTKTRFNIPAELREDFTVVKLQPKSKVSSWIKMKLKGGRGWKFMCIKLNSFRRSQHLIL